MRFGGKAMEAEILSTDEILIRIFFYTDYDDVIMLSRVCLLFWRWLSVKGSIGPTKHFLADKLWEEKTELLLFSPFSTRWINELIKSKAPCVPDRIRYDEFRLIEKDIDNFRYNPGHLRKVYDYSGNQHGNNSRSGDHIGYLFHLGRLDLILYLVRSNVYIDRISTMLDYAAIEGHIHILEWFHARGMKGVPSFCAYDCISGGHMNVVKWLVDHNVGLPSNLDEKLQMKHMPSLDYDHTYSSPRSFYEIIASSKQPDVLIPLLQRVGFKPGYLFWLASLRNELMMEYLLSLGIDDKIKEGMFYQLCVWGDFYDLNILRSKWISFPSHIIIRHTGPRTSRKVLENILTWDIDDVTQTHLRALLG